MNPTLEPFIPPAHLAEEWDNPAMAEFKRQEAEERAEFGCSQEAQQWLANFQATTPPDFVIRRAPMVPKQFPFKPVKLPW